MKYWVLSLASMVAGLASLCFDTEYLKWFLVASAVFLVLEALNRGQEQS